VPACENKTCGDDGCGGLCGDCLAGQTCTDFACVDAPDPGAATDAGTTPGNMSDATSSADSVGPIDPNNPGSGTIGGPEDEGTVGGEGGDSGDAASGCQGGRDGRAPWALALLLLAMTTWRRRTAWRLS
jgi:MYXO-CTERM domain-containing protein